ncbi:MAG: hypothetical protein AAB486_01645 [Patescibacteria group bacterium]
MITLFYGPDLSSSRQEFLRFKAEFAPAEVVSLPEDTKAVAILAALETSPLFGPHRLFTIESFSGKVPLFKDSYFLDYLPRLPEGSAIVFWVGEGLLESSLFMKTLRSLKADVRQFKEKKAGSVFPFLAALLSGNRAAAYRDLISLIREEQNGFYILTMIAWQLRQLLTFCYDPRSPLISSFGRSSLSAIAKRYPVSRLEALYRRLHRTDRESKSGGDINFELFKFVETVNG